MDLGRGIPRILWDSGATGKTVKTLPWRGTSPPGIVRGTAASLLAAWSRRGRATSGYFSCRLLLRCGDYVCPLICAETRQLGPLSARPRRSVGLWVCGSSRASRYVLSFITGLSRTLFVLPSRSMRERPLVFHQRPAWKRTTLLSAVWSKVFDFFSNVLIEREQLLF